MRRHLRHRFWSADGDPGPLAWAIASISLLLPVAGVVLALVGGFKLMRGDAEGWVLAGAGVVCIALDILIDFVWAHPGVLESDQPHLNQRGAQLIGRNAIVVEAIENGRGKVRIGDSVWPAEGPDVPKGATARILAAKATVLLIGHGQMDKSENDL